MSSTSTRLRLAAIAMLSFVLVLTAARSALAQQDGPPPVDGAQRELVVNAAADLLIEHYVFPDVAEQCADHIKARLAEGAYDDLTDPNAFGRALTMDLRSVCNDRHMGVGPYPPDAFDEPDEEELQRQRERRIEQIRRRNFGFQKLERMQGNVGYLDLRGFQDTGRAGPTAVAAMNFLAHADAIIIDLRQNGGGSPTMIQLISSYFFDEPTHLNSFEVRGQEQIDQTWTLPHVPGPKMVDTPLFVLTSNRTFSAAEEFTYNLKNLKRATIVGESTGGGAHPVGGHKIDDVFAIRVPYARAINPISGTNWEGVGVDPDISVPADDALDAAHLEALTAIEPTLADDAARAALRWAIDGLNAKLHPFEPEYATLQAYVGDYGQRHITIEEAVLYYQRDDGPRRRLIPFAADMFTIESVEYFRMKFDRDADGGVTAIIGSYDDGHTDRSARDG